MNIRVVVADDAPDVRLLVRMMLSMDPDIELLAEVSTPEDALEACTTLQPDVIICDHSFESDTTGIDIAPAVRSASPATKFVLFSAYDNLHDQIAATESIDAFVLKTDSTSLPTTVRQLAGTK